MERMIHVLFIVIELQVLLLSNIMIFGTKIPLFVLNGYSARDSGYRAATNINYMKYEKPSFLAQSAIMMADCQRKPCGRPSCTRKPSGTH